MNVEDKLIWHFDRLGRYSTKSGYHVARLMGESNGVSSGAAAGSSSLDPLVMNIWRLQIPNKIKIFLWRLWTNSLPTRFNLHKRKVILTPLYSLCGASIETAFHALRVYSQVKQVGSASGLLKGQKASECEEGWRLRGS